MQSGTAETATILPRLPQSPAPPMKWVCCWRAASWSTLCRIVAKANDISLRPSAWEKELADGAGAGMSEAVCASGVACA